MGNLYTIGYANKNIDDFIKILQVNKINCIIDVRSMPYSKQFSDYNEIVLREKLKDSNIIYMSFKNEFGARRIEKEAYSKVDLYDGSHVDVVVFEKVYELDIFQKGYNRVKKGLDKGYNIAFLCSEKNPYDCHRCIMVSEYFYRNGYGIDHIIDDKSIINHIEIEKYLKENFDKAKEKFQKINESELKELIYGGGLFSSQTDEEVIKWNEFFSEFEREKGFYLRNLEIGYKKGNEEND